MPDDRPPHADWIEDADERHRRKWAEFIINNPDAFYAALKGISEAKYLANLIDIEKESPRDFAPKELTELDKNSLQAVEEQFLQQMKEPQSKPEKELTISDRGWYEFKSPKDTYGTEITDDEAHQYALDRGIDLPRIQKLFTEHNKKQQPVKEGSEPITGQGSRDGLNLTMDANGFCLTNDEEHKEIGHNEAIKIAEERGVFLIPILSAERNQAKEDARIADLENQIDKHRDRKKENAQAAKDEEWEIPAQSDKEAEQGRGAKGKLILPPSERSPEEQKKLAEKRQARQASQPRQDKDHDR